MSFVQQQIRWVVLSLCLCAVYALAWSGAVQIPLGAPGSRDFVQYWSAWELLRHGLNPYDGQLMREIQAMISHDRGDVTMMWNPPWTPILLLPVLVLPFERAAALWFLCQLGFAVILALFLPRAINRPKLPLILSGVVTFSFLPVLDCFSWGQLSLLLTLSATMFVYYEGRGMLLAAGIALVPLTLKPHLLLFMMPAGFLWWWRLTAENRGKFVLGYIGSLLLLCLIVMLLAPKSVMWWVATLLDPQSVVSAVPTVSWKTATLTTWVRMMLADGVQSVPLWPMVWLPVLSLAAVTFFYARYRPVVRWRTTIPTITAIALLTGAYGWLYDQSILLLGLLVVAGDAWSSEKRMERFRGVMAVVGLEALAIVQSCIGYNQQHYFVWIPLAVLCLLGAHKNRPTWT